MQKKQKTQEWCKCRYLVRIQLSTPLEREKHIEKAKLTRYDKRRGYECDVQEQMGWHYSLTLIYIEYR